MKRRIFLSILLCVILAIPVRADSIKWVDFCVPYESLKYALDKDIGTYEKEKHLNWIDILSIAACRTGGTCGLDSVKKAAFDLSTDKSPEALLGGLYKYHDYYRRSFDAALGGLVGAYAIEIDGDWKQSYGLKAFSPIGSQRKPRRDIATR